MKTWARRIRGAIGIGVSWALGWAPVGAITGWVAGLVLGFPMGVISNYALLFGALGLAGGAIFSAVLSVAEGRSRFDQLSYPRFTLWGGVGGLGLAAIAVAAGLLGAGVNGLGVALAGVCTLLGAASAAGTLAVAKAADRQLLIEADQQVRRTGLSSEEMRHLLGEAK